MKNKIKRTVAVLLALVMALSLAACGSKEAPVEVAAPEYVYAAEYTPLAEDSENYVSPQVYTEDGFYATTFEKVGEEIPEGVTPEYEGQYYIYGSKLWFYGFDGTVTHLDAYEPLPRPENTEELRDFSSGAELCSIALTPGGELLALENTYSSWYEGPEGLTGMDAGYYEHSKYSRSLFIRSLDKTGKELSCAEIELAEDDYINSYSIHSSPNGELVVTSDAGIRLIGLDGKEIKRIETESYVDYLVELQDGALAACFYGNEGMSLSYIDLESGSLGEGIPLPNEAYSFSTGGGDYDLYYNSGSNLYGYDLETQTKEKIFNWTNCDVNANDLGPLKVMEDGSFRTLCNTYISDGDDENSFRIELIDIKKVPADSLPQKETLTFAACYVDYNVMEMIIKFNRSNPNYRIEVRDYSEYNTEEDYQAGLTKLLTEIMAGNVPDIMALEGLPYSRLVSKGILEDLYPLIDADSQLSREDFFTNVLSALEVDGKLCSTASGFSVESVIGAKSVVGDRIGWTYEELDEALSTMPEGCELFYVYTVRGTVLRNCLQLDMDRYVNWATGECDFDNEDFVKLLEFSSRFASEEEMENYEWNEGDDPLTRIAEGRQMLLQTSLYSFEDINYNSGYFGGDVSFVGYPTADGSSGNMLNVIGRYAISGSCANKEAAWEFLRSFFTEEYQRSNVWCFSTRKDVYDKKEEKAMTPRYKKDAEGNILLDEDGNRIELSSGSMGMPGGSVVEFYALTQAQADQIRQVISSTDSMAVYDYNDKIYEIVLSQAEAFFAGQKSAQDVARLIQSEVNIYVNEQR